jgi:NADH:ubiquinone oxidoreductase subunit E
MKRTVKVKICVGTYSYVMGGAELLEIEKRLPGHLSGRVEVEGAIEMQGVDENTMNPPFVSVNGKIIPEATDQKVIQAIEKELKNVETA